MTTYAIAGRQQHYKVEIRLAYMRAAGRSASCGEAVSALRVRWYRGGDVAVTPVNSMLHLHLIFIADRLSLLLHRRPRYDEGRRSDVVKEAVKAVLLR